MKIDEAIERLEVFLGDVSEGAPELLDDALKLGISALKWVALERTLTDQPIFNKLPGETKE